MIKAIIRLLLNRRYIGARHTPEEKLIVYRTKWLNKQELKEFEIQYRMAINAEIIMRYKKRTGKGTGWHISLNPRKLKEAYEMIEND